jgi:hypothetical protein
MSSLKECIECQQKHGVNIDWCLACVKRKQNSIHVVGEILEVSPKEREEFLKKAEETVRLKLKEKTAIPIK